ncbi:hypothetical protein BTR14_15690 [Rhizobium rhizosphaerae]|uniref:DUF2934 domain-containing protein n=1 Tax=Xaviernesmea rhizosphaerae TaxID=1672749 RepID=A0ABX3PBD1_9HYPH|nr:DUF2934 domain-containing protein [Xaviernesmea rhizosphaerae]OQP85346.1 hypothetical protein BTR14_15690 [Xaviernesmea rhizosphaerae]
MSIDEDKIRARAYRLWEEEGRPQGRHDHHWQQALSEVTGQSGSPQSDMTDQSAAAETGAATEIASAAEETPAQPAERKARSVKAAAPKPSEPKAAKAKTGTSKAAAAKPASAKSATSKAKAAKDIVPAAVGAGVTADLTPPAPIAETVSAEAPQPKRRGKVATETA